MKKFIKESLRARLLNEARLKLSPQDMDFLNSLIPKYIEVFKEGNLIEFKNGKSQYMGTHTYKMASGEDAKVNFWVQYTENRWKGWFLRNDEKNLNDQVIALNINYFSPAFKPMLFRIFKSITGMDGTEDVRETLYHEMIHAKDPAANHHALKEPTDSSKPEVYYGSWAEFPTMTGQFMEAIVNKFNDYMSQIDYSDETEAKQKILKLSKILQNILDFFSGIKPMTHETMYFIEDRKDNGVQNFMKKIVRFAEEFFGSNVHTYQAVSFYNSLLMIKKYNPEGWKEFHKDLYLTIQNCVEKMNDSLVSNFDAYNKEKPFVSVGGQGSFKNLKEDKNKNK